MGQYTDVFIRDNFGDTGTTPSAGVIFLSPDIIPMQSGTLAFAKAISTYNGPDLGKTIINQSSNNIYVRAKNLQPSGTETASVQLYYARTSLLMLPAQWRENSVQTATGEPSAPFVNQSGSSDLHPNDIVLGSPAFNLTGLPPGPSRGYCLVAVVQTPRTVVTIPTTFASNSAFTSWVRNNAAVAWRNIVVVPNRQQQIVETAAFASTNPDEADFHFRLLGRNYPVGSGVSAVCTDQRCPVDWTGTLPAPDPKGHQITGFDVSVPGNFTGALIITVTAPRGQSFRPGASLEVTYYQYPPQQPDELDRSVAAVYPIVRSQDGVQRAAFSAYLIQLGQVTFVVPAGE